MGLSSDEEAEADSGVLPLNELDDDISNEAMIEMIGDISDNASPGADLAVGDDIVVFSPRAYQLEMFAESLKRNIIVAVSLETYPIQSMI